MPDHHNTYPVPKRNWTRVTPDAVDKLRLQSQGPYPLHVMVNQSSTVAPPIPPNGTWVCDRNIALTTEDPLATLFPSRVDGSGFGWVWVWSDSEGQVSVDYDV